MQIKNRIWRLPLLRLSICLLLVGCDRVHHSYSTALISAGLSETDVVADLCYASDGETLFAAIAPTLPPRIGREESSKNRVVAWDRTTLSVIGEHKTNLQPTAIALCPGGSQLAVVECLSIPHFAVSPREGLADYRNYGSLSILDCTTLRERRTLEINHSLLALAFSPDGSRLALLGASGNSRIVLSLRDWPSLDPIDEFTFEGCVPSPVGAGFTDMMQFTSDGRWLFASTYLNDGCLQKGSREMRKGTIAVIDVVESVVHGEIELDGFLASHISASKDSKYLLATDVFESRLFELDFSKLTPKLANLLPLGPRCMGVFRADSTNEIIGIASQTPQEDSSFWAGTYGLREEGAKRKWHLVEVYHCKQPNWNRINTAFAYSADRKEFAIGTSGAVAIWDLKTKSQ